MGSGQNGARWRGPHVGRLCTVPLDPLSLELDECEMSVNRGGKQTGVGVVKPKKLQECSGSLAWRLVISGGVCCLAWPLLLGLAPPFPPMLSKFGC